MNSEDTFSNESKFYNMDTTEILNEATMVNGTPSGVISFKHTPHQWAVGIYKLMQSYTWYISECGIETNAGMYKMLPDNRRRAFDMVLAQLIADDSLQTTQLPIGVVDLITSPIVTMVLARQAYEEGEHVHSYSVIADEMCEDVDRIYNMHLHEPALERKNKSVLNLYGSLNYVKGTITDQEKLLVFAANQILEQVVFPGGFLVMWSMNIPSVSTCISFIERDETGTHVPLFRNIFRTTVREVGIEQSTIDSIVESVKTMVGEEIIWTQHITEDLLGFTDNSIRLFVEYMGNSVMKNLKLPIIYEETNGGPLMKLYNKNSLLAKSSTGEEIDTKTNTFEVVNADYAINSISKDF